MNDKTSAFLLLLVFAISGCTDNQQREPTSSSDSELENVLALPDTVVFHSAQGRVRSINPSKTFIIIRHSAIDSFMSAMTMPFPVDDSTVVDGVEQGDSIAFEISVQGSLVAVSAIEVIE